MKTSGFLIALCLWFSTGLGVSAKDAVFESSDGLWTDGTYESKGRDFHVVLVGFEHYKMRENKPDLTLVRVTPQPTRALFRSSQDKLDPKWKVPFAPPSGHARSNVTAARSHIQEAEVEEVRRRAEAALALWKSK